jgi:hypothetical protein
LTEYGAIDDIRAAVPARVPRILEARERAPVEGRIRVRDVGRKGLPDLVISRAILDREVVRLEVNITEERLEWSALRPGADERAVTGGSNDERRGICIVQIGSLTNVLAVPDVHERRRGRLRVEGNVGGQLAEEGERRGAGNTHGLVIISGTDEDISRLSFGTVSKSTIINVGT